MKTFAVLVAWLALLGCTTSPEEKKPVEGKAATSAAVPGPATVTLDDHGDPKGIHRHRRWSEKIGQGAQPEGEEAFKNLQALGYVTIISVDGAVPAVELAAKYGLKYAHVPIGYDGITLEEQLQIIKTAKESAGPVFVHCHHGKHRGPAAAMIARVALEGVSCDDAVKAMELSETSKDYAGLYRDVGQFKKPTDAQIAAAPRAPAAVKPKGVRAAMVQVDERFEFLKASMGNGWNPPANSPDVSPKHEAKMLWELYREMARLEESKAHGDEFMKYSAEAEKGAGELEEALKAGNTDAATAAYKKLKKNCDACHSVYRNH